MLEDEPRDNDPLRRAVKQDELGRVSDANQTMNLQAYPFHMTYLLNDALKTIKYPSNRVVTSGYD